MREKIGPRGPKSFARTFGGAAVAAPGPAAAGILMPISFPVANTVRTAAVPMPTTAED